MPRSPSLEESLRLFMKKSAAKRSGDPEAIRRADAEIDQAMRECELEMERASERIKRQADALWDDQVAQGADPDPAVVWGLARWLTTRRHRPAPAKPAISTVVAVAPRTTAVRPRERRDSSASRSSSGGGGPDSDDPSDSEPSPGRGTA